MFDRHQPGERAAPTATAVRIESMGIGLFEIPQRAYARTRQRTFALRATKKEYVRKLFHRVHVAGSLVWHVRSG
jgi:hypothetical protein